MRSVVLSFGLVLCVIVPARAAVVGTLTGLVVDPQQRPVAAASLVLRSRTSEWQQDVRSNASGRFTVSSVPSGDYSLTTSAPGFAVSATAVLVRSGVVTDVTIPLTLSAVVEQVDVRATAGDVNVRTHATTSMVTRRDIERTPGAHRTNSLAMITSFVPGAYLTHNQLHVRGGHPVSWLVDGVPVPNTNIANTVGPQFEPNDVETLEVLRGGFSAEYGDRTSAVFNVLPRSGFERSREGEAAMSAGSYNDVSGSFSAGDHSQHAAYFASVSANRSDVGLEPPVPEPIHDEVNGLGTFASVILRPSSRDELRFVGSLRRDHYELPNTPDEQASGVRNTQHERDGFLNTSWVRTIGPATLLTVSPFYHYARSAYDGSGGEDAVTIVDHRDSHYLGLQSVLSHAEGSHTARGGVYAFHQHDSALFGLASPDALAPIAQEQSLSGHLVAVFAEDQYTVRDWLTIGGGLRATWFSGLISESAVDPRLGVAVRFPWAWVARGSYNRYYQAPPLSTVDGPLLEAAAEDGFGFLPLKGERDEQWETGLSIPVRGWVGDVTYFHTRARNYFDHDAIGDTNIFIPLTIDTARIKGTEVTVRSPRFARTDMHVAYAHLTIQGRGGVTGGLTSDEEEEGGDDYFYLDHDQRHTLSVGATTELPRRLFLSGTVEYGSGFLKGEGPDHNSPHATWNLQASKTFSSAWSVSVTALNVADSRFFLDEANTFGGTHYNQPRQILASAKYRFHY